MIRLKNKEKLKYVYVDKMKQEDIYKIKSVYDTEKGKMVRFSLKRQLKKHGVICFANDSGFWYLFNEPVKSFKIK